MPRYVFAEFREQRIRDASIEVDMGGEVVITIPPQECWPDKLPRDPEKSFRMILGDEQMDVFLAAGGTMRLLDSIYEDAQGQSKGK